MTTATCGAASTMIGAPLTWFVDPPAAGCGAVAPSCPGSFATADGTACSGSDDAVTCDYAEGRCLCDACIGPTGSTTRWHCRAWSDVPTGCPVPRPVAGSRCATEGLHCDYAGNCCQHESLGANLVCTDGTWAIETYEDPSCLCLVPAC